MHPATTLRKTSSGVEGLDEITGGGLPVGRATLVCGSAGSGKTLFGVQFLVKGILEHGENGLFVSFEETADEIAQNVHSLGWDLTALQDSGSLVVDHVRMRADEIQETGDYDLEALFIRLGAAIDAVGAKRVVLDTLEVLFSTLRDQAVLRSELRRLFRWLKDRGVTAVITSERGEGSLTRHGLEEYVSDCVLLLDFRVVDQLSTRRLRVVKYRGASHSSDECPFIIDAVGFRAMPLSSMRLAHAASDKRVSSGVPQLDAMLGGQGCFRGSSVLVSGSPGCGKTILAASFAVAGCERGEKSLLLAFEESPQQLRRNLASVGLDLQPHLDAGLLRIFSNRPSAYGYEAHLSTMLAQIGDFDPDLVVIDPISAFGGNSLDRQALFTRLIDHLKTRGATAVCTSLVGGQSELSGAGLSSIIDTWIMLMATEQGGERRRALTVIKSRGMSHSNQVREMSITDEGVDLGDVHTGHTSAGRTVTWTASS